MGLGREWVPRWIVTMMALCAAAWATTGAMDAQQVDVTRLGPQVGAAAVDFSLPDQDGALRSLASLAGPKGTMLVFSRSADWCPYCRTQMVELQRNLETVRGEGYGLAVVTYDSPAVLRTFAGQHGITYPLLSDRGSKVITAWGILNREAMGRAAGIPHPGTFVIDRQGRIVSRAFEQSYTERRTATSVLANLDSTGPILEAAAIVEGRQIRIRVGASDTVVAPGERITLLLDVAAGERMHVYAPGQAGYIPIRLTLAESEAYRVHQAVYPVPKPYRFAPLDETVRVYDSGFRIAQDVTIGLTRDLRRMAEAGEPLTITGTLEYQACDDAVCYRPETLPVHWTFSLTPIDRPAGRGGR